jgi:hypothetical protein
MVRVRMTYLLATLALLVALPCLVGLVTPGPSATETWMTFGVAGTIAALVLGLEARRDGYAFAQFVLVMLLFPLTFAIAAHVVAETAEGRRRAVMAGVVSLLGMGWAAVRLWREHHAQGELSNRLLEQFHRNSIFEIDGVHWTGTQGPAELGDENWVRIYLQNAVAAERTVTITFEDVAGLRGKRGSLLLPRIDPVRIGPGEVGSLLVPVNTGPRPARTTDLYVSVKARGPAGRRLRPFRARAASERTRRGFQLIALIAGHLVWGGGVRFRFQNPRELTNLRGEPDGATWESIEPPMGGGP